MSQSNQPIAVADKPPQPLTLGVLLRLAGPVWVARLALRRLKYAWHRLVAPRRPRPFPPARTRTYKGKPPRFFIAQENREHRAELVERACTGTREKTLAAAEHVLAHRFDVLGSGPIDFGPDIDWHADFRTGYRWPLTHHLRLNHPPLESPHDVKIPWELSRCHHFLTLGRAYAFTGDERYAREFVAQVESWLAANPPGFGVNWANTMEVAIRTVNWIWAYTFFEGANALTTEFEDAFLKAMDAHGRHIIRNLETTWPPTNHLIANFCGLVYLGVMFPQLRGARRRLRRGLRGLLQALATQVHLDGVADEGSTGYHRLVAALFVHPVALLQLNGVPLPERFLAQLEKMFKVIQAYVGEACHHPHIGDADDGKLLWLSEHDPRDACYLLPVGAALFERPDLAAGVRDEHWQDALWLFGEDAVRVKEEAGASEAAPVSTYFPEGGFVFMRHEHLYLSLDAGPNAQRGGGGHNHNDTLSITLSTYGTSFLVDPGTYAYTGDVEARNRFRSTSAHNTLQVDGLEQNRFVPTELFRLNDDATPTVHLWKSTPVYDLVDASHDGYARLPGRVVHRRQILFDKQEGFWLLRDVVTGEGEHDLVWLFHFAPMRVQSGPDDVIVGRAVSGGLLMVPLRPEVVELALSEDWLSPSYGVRQLAPLATYSRRAILPATFAVVLYPYQAEEPPYDRARAAGERALARLEDETSSV